MNLRPRFSLKRLLRHGRAEVRRSLQARTVALTVILTLAVAIVFMGFKVVPQGSEWTVERFGRYTNTLKPGLNIIVPVMEIGRAHV